MANNTAPAIPVGVAVIGMVALFRSHPNAKEAFIDFFKEWAPPAIFIILALALSLAAVALLAYGIYRLIKQNDRPHAIPSVVSILMLIVTFFGPPGGYYDVLRFVVCGTAVFVAFVGYKNGFEWAVWLFGPTALLFNPMFPFHLGRGMWAVVDVAIVILFVVGITVIRMRDVAHNESVVKTDSQSAPRRPDNVQEAVIVTVMDPNDTASSKPKQLSILLPQINDSKTVPQPEDMVPEIDDFILVGGALCVSHSENNSTPPPQNIVDSSAKNSRSKKNLSPQSLYKKAQRYEERGATEATIKNYYMLSAKEGFTGAHLALADMCFDSGDWDEGMSWLEKAAALGDYVAMCRIGDVYRDGDGVDVDYKEALKWYRCAGCTDKVDALLEEMRPQSPRDEEEL